MKAPNKGSLLSPLWPVVESHFQSAASTSLADASIADTHESDATAQQAASGEAASIRDTHASASPNPDTHVAPIEAPLLIRVPSNWQPPEPDIYSWPSRHAHSTAVDVPPSFDWASPDARDIGTVVHDHLQRLSEPGLRASGEVGVRDGTLEVVIRRQLQIMGVSEARVPAAAQRVMRALVNTLGDERGKWCLEAHEQARSEWALTVPHTEAGFVGVQKVVIDRTFVDAQGTRWIIDFKSGEHEGADRDGFLDKEQARYEGQLNGYAAVLRAFEDRPIRLGLWFPMLKGWREWQPPI